MASAGRLYSDLDSGDDEEEEESHDSRNTIDNEIYMNDEVDEGKFFAGVFTSQRSEEDLIGYAGTVITRRKQFLLFHYIDLNNTYLYVCIFLIRTLVFCNLKLILKHLQFSSAPYRYV